MRGVTCRAAATCTRPKVEVVVSVVVSVIKGVLCKDPDRACMLVRPAQIALDGAKVVGTAWGCYQHPHVTYDTSIIKQTDPIRKLMTSRNSLIRNVKRDI